MPEPTITPATGAGEPPATTPAAPAAPAAPPAAPVTFESQAELDAVIQDRLARERAKTATENAELARKAKLYDAAQKAGQSELEQEKAARTEAEAERDRERAQALTVKRETALLLELSEQKALNPSLLVRLLMDDATVTVKDGAVTGAKEAVARLLKEYPNFKAGTPAAASGASFSGGTPGKGIDEQIAEAQKAGNYQEAIRLKLVKAQPPA